MGAGEEAGGGGGVVAHVVHNAGDGAEGASHLIACDADGAGSVW